jgi:hypothetical protein
MEQFKIGDYVKWIDGMSFERHGQIYDCFSEPVIKISSGGILFMVDRNKLTKE